MKRNINIIALTVLICNTTVISTHHCCAASENEKSVRRTVEQKYDDPELVELCLSGMERSNDIHYLLKQFCPGATTGGAKAVSRILIASFIKAHGANIEIGTVSKSEFPCTDILNLLKSDVADPEFDNKTHLSGPDISPDSRRPSTIKKGLRTNLSLSERTLLKKELESTVPKLVSVYRNYKVKVNDLRRSTEDLEKLQAKVDELRPSQTDLEKIKLNSMLMARQSEISSNQAICKRYRQILIDLAGTEAANRVDQSLNPEVRQGDFGSNKLNFVPGQGPTKDNSSPPAK